MVQLSHSYMSTGKTIALTTWTLVGTVMSLLFNMLSRSVAFFLPRGKCLLVSWIQSLSALILKAKKIKSVIVFPYICHEVMELEAMILAFWMLSFKPAFSPSSRSFLGPLHFMPPLGWCHQPHPIWGYWYFSQETLFQIELHPAWHFDNVLRT